MEMYEEYYGKQISKLERQVEALFKINKNLKKELDTEKRKRKELADKNQELRKDLAKANKTIEDLTLRLKKIVKTQANHHQQIVYIQKKYIILEKKQEEK